VGAAEAIPGLFELQTLELPEAHAALPLPQRLRQLPKLQQLEVGLHACTPQQLQQVFEAIGSGTQLTYLHLFHREACLDFSFYPRRTFTVELEGVEVQAQLGKLRRLQQLKLQQIKWDVEGARQLTVLMSVTALTLNECDIADLGLAAVFQRLTGLRSLKVTDSTWENNLLYATLGFLSGLQILHLSSNDNWVMDKTLPLLSPLTNLTWLLLDDPQYEAGEGPCVSQGAERAFVAGMPLLDEIWCL
jgi:hypothetical protein